MKFKEFTDKWFTANEPQWKESTKRNYRSWLKCHVEPALGHLDVKQISKLDISKLKSRLTSKKLSPKMVDLVLVFVKQLMNELEDNNLIDTNPATKVKLVKGSKPEIHPFSPDELSRLFAVLPDLYKPFFALMLNTGARPNELAALTWKDIDLTNGVIKIERGLVHGVTDTPKTDAGTRNLPITDKIAEILTTIPQYPKDKNPDGYLFLNQKGKPHHYTHQLSDAWHKACLDAGVEPRSCYQLRHTFASTLLDNGLPINFISKQLGHAQIGITIKCYLHHTNNKEEYAKQVDRMNQILNGVSGNESKEASIS